MRKILFYCASALCLLFVAVKPSLAGPCSPDTDEAPGIYVPDRGCAEIGFGYQYQHYDVLGQTFSDNGYNVDLWPSSIRLAHRWRGPLDRGRRRDHRFRIWSHRRNPIVWTPSRCFFGGGPHARHPEPHTPRTLDSCPAWFGALQVHPNQQDRLQLQLRFHGRRRGGCPNESRNLLAHSGRLPGNDFPVRRAIELLRRNRFDFLLLIHA